MPNPVDVSCYGDRATHSTEKAQAYRDGENAARNQIVDMLIERARLLRMQGTLPPEVANECMRLALRVRDGRHLA